MIACRPFYLCLCLIAMLVASLGAPAQAQSPPSAAGNGEARFGRPITTGLFIATEESPEVNINRLTVGPRGWIVGSAEENGWLFFFNPETQELVQWNAGRTEPATGYPFEGDITDFEVWEENGRIVIVACQALPPAEIFRYEIPVSEAGRPDIGGLTVRRVYSNARWGRVMSIGRGRSSTGKELLLAGSYGHAELIRSDDGGETWQAVDYWSSVRGLDGRQHRAQVSGGNASLSEIHYVDEPSNPGEGVWLIFLYHTFVFADEMPWDSGDRHCLNGILVSRDGGESWEMADVEPRSGLPESIQAAVERDRAKERLDPRLYGFVGEAAQSLAVLPDGSFTIGTAYDNISQPLFGGRILRSDDRGLTWYESFAFPSQTDVRVASVGDDILLAGTTTHWFPVPEHVREASGDLYLSTDRGTTFQHLAQVIRETRPADYRRPSYTNYFYAGIGAIASTERLVVVGTVNESRRAELVILPRNP